MPHLLLNRFTLSLLKINNKNQGELIFVNNPNKGLK